jgi:hypothetical protein
MASRLSVLMIQSKPPNFNAQRLADEVVGSLIGAPGLDLMLIEPPASLTATATDRLTLETLTGDVAVLDWEDPEQTIQGLTAVNFSGQRTPHPHDRDAPQAVSAARSVFAFDLRRFVTARELLTALHELNSRRQVRTFGIGVVPVAAQAPVSVIPRSPSASAEATELAKATAVTPVSVTAKGPVESIGVGDSTSLATSTPGRAAKRLDLDDLLDQLDRADP